MYILSHNCKDCCLVNDITSYSNGFNGNVKRDAGLLFYGLLFYEAFVMKLLLSIKT